MAWGHVTHASWRYRHSKHARQWVLVIDETEQRKERRNETMERKNENKNTQQGRDGKRMAMAQTSPLMNR